MKRVSTTAAVEEPPHKKVKLDDASANQCLFDRLSDDTMIRKINTYLSFRDKAAFASVNRQLNYKLGGTLKDWLAIHYPHYLPLVDAKACIAHVLHEQKTAIRRIRSDPLPLVAAYLQANPELANPKQYTLAHLQANQDLLIDLELAQEIEYLKAKHANKQDPTLRKLLGQLPITLPTTNDARLTLNTLLDDINLALIRPKINLNSTTLNLLFCGITRLPASLLTDPGLAGYWAELTELYCTGNRLTILPNLDKLTQLQVLDCTSNRLKILPNLDKLTQLRWLSCPGNHLRVLPNLDNLTQLQKLNCPYNQINALANIEKIIAIPDVNFSYNPIPWLPRNTGNNFTFKYFAQEHLDGLQEKPVLSQRSFSIS